MPSFEDAKVEIRNIIKRHKGVSHAQVAHEMPGDYKLFDIELLIAGLVEAGEVNDVRFRDAPTADTYTMFLFMPDWCFDESARNT